MGKPYSMDLRERIRAEVIANVSAFEQGGKVRVPGVARCIVGTA